MRRSLGKRGSARIAAALFALGIVLIPQEAFVSTFVDVSREDSFFRWRTSRHFGREIGGTDSTKGGNWRIAHDKFLAMIEPSVTRALSELKKEGKIGLAELKRPGLQYCSAPGTQGPCITQTEFRLQPELIRMVLAKAPDRLKKGKDSIYPRMRMAENGKEVREESSLSGDHDISILAVSDAEALVFSLEFVAQSEPGAVLAKRIEEAIIKRIRADLVPAK